ncbi:BQ2448_7620 [Microbotryum intermedium]|uniref:BQ2448_7620 protein n=1 Tax=Microbotryum intermedium TaxID=269621 RepID=A0A238FQX1_9BASI|nr:BQ2448_7620 [Microbotryum intermedium]
MPGGYFHYESDSSVPSSSDDRSLSSPATSLMNHKLSATSTSTPTAAAGRGSLNLSPSSTRSGGAIGDPFVDPRLSLDSWSRSSMESGLYEARPYHASEQDGSSSPRPGMMPAMGRSNSDVQRDLHDALEEGLPTPREENLLGLASRIMSRSEGKKSSAGSTHSGSTSGGGGFLSQFRTGSGWFAPVVPPEPKLTRAEREQLEKERIEQLRTQGANASRKRPSFMKRMSSGVEMMGSFGKDSSGASPAKLGRARSGTATTITEANRG